jgi:DMSO/TMAO reductase YedYZ molybdopterin-dependent catalytic subunit
MRTPLRTGALVGLASAAVTVALMFALRLAFGLLSLPDVAADAMTLILPGGFFGYLIDRLQHFGRPLMLLGLSVSLLALGAAAGAVTERSLAGRPLAVRLGLPTLALSALTLPAVLLGASDIAAVPALTTVASWSLFSVLLNAGLAHAAAAPLVRALPSLSRRSLLYGSGAIGVLWLGSYFGGRLVAAAEKTSRPPAAATAAPTAAAVTAAPPQATPPVGAATTPVPEDPFPGITGITTTKDFYVISKNGVDDPAVNVATWRLRVEGQRPFSLTHDELRGLESVEFTETLECISNNVGGPLLSTAVFRGVRLRDLLERAGLPAGTREIRFNCADGYTESIPLETANDPRTIVVHLMNGEPLTKEHGFPARILMSGRYGMKNPKWVTAILPVPQPYGGYWEVRGWNKDAFVRTMSRLDHPQESDVVPSGKPYPFVRGVAYAGARGISKVEISFDGGRTWDEARLRRILPPDNWTPFWYVWTPPRPGMYDVRVRATDGDGRLQDAEERDSFPDGATGIHRVTVKVA